MRRGWIPLLIAAVVALGSLAACGGGDDPVIPNDPNSSWGSLVWGDGTWSN